MMFFVILMMASLVDSSMQKRHRKKKKRRRSGKKKYYQNLPQKLSSSITKEEVDFLVSKFNDLSPKEIKKLKKVNLLKEMPNSILTKREKRLIYRSIREQGSQVLRSETKLRKECLRLYTFFEVMFYSLGRRNRDCVQKIDFIEDSLVYYDDFILNQYNFNIERCFQMKLESRICGLKRNNFFN